MRLLNKSLDGVLRQVPRQGPSTSSGNTREPLGDRAYRFLTALRLFSSSSLGIIHLRWLLLSFRSSVRRFASQNDRGKAFTAPRRSFDSPSTSSGNTREPLGDRANGFLTALRLFPSSLLGIHRVPRQAPRQARGTLGNRGLCLCFIRRLPCSLHSLAMTPSSCHVEQSKPTNEAWAETTIPE